MSRLPVSSLRELRHALSLRDLTDPAAGPHAMQRVLAALPLPVHVERASPIVSVADNYDRLGYPPEGAARDARYTRYVCDSAVLRSQTSAMLPPLLERAWPDDVLLACPGLVYRRDCIDRMHVGALPADLADARGQARPLDRDPRAARPRGARRPRPLRARPRADLVESIELASVTPGHALPASARGRIGMREDEHDALVRITLRALDRSLRRPSATSSATRFTERSTTADVINGRAAEPRKNLRRRIPGVTAIVLGGTRVLA